MKQRSKNMYIVNEPVSAIYMAPISSTTVEWPQSCIRKSHFHSAAMDHVETSYEFSCE